MERINKSFLSFGCSLSTDPKTQNSTAPSDIIEKALRINEMSSLSRNRRLPRANQCALRKDMNQYFLVFSNVRCAWACAKLRGSQNPTALNSMTILSDLLAPKAILQI